MTTIAYRDGVIAGDTQVTAGGMKVGSAQKVFKKGKRLWGFAGSLALCQAYSDWVKTGRKGEPPELTKEDDLDGFVIEDGKIVSYNHNGKDTIEAEYYASGSGWLIAMGAMAMGATAEEAVRCAIKHDNGSGGDITVFNVND